MLFGKYGFTTISFNDMMYLYEMYSVVLEAQHGMINLTGERDNDGMTKLTQLT